MNAPHLSIGGRKGGVGKRSLAFARVDYLIAREKNVLLLETDTSNPDVCKAHLPRENSALICKLMNLDRSAAVFLGALLPQKSFRKSMPNGASVGPRR